MYLARRPRPSLADPEPAASAESGWRRLIVAPNVALLGATSMITDVSSEMVASVLPLYLTARLGFTALQFGATDGLLQVAMAVTALIGALPGRSVTSATARSPESATGFPPLRDLVSWGRRDGCRRSDG